MLGSSICISTKQVTEHGKRSPCLGEGESFKLLMRPLLFTKEDKTELASLSFPLKRIETGHLHHKLRKSHLQGKGSACNAKGQDECRFSLLTFGCSCEEWFFKHHLAFQWWSYGRNCQKNSSQVSRQCFKMGTKTRFHSASPRKVRERYLRGQWYLLLFLSRFSLR